MMGKRLRTALVCAAMMVAGMDAFAQAADATSGASENGDANEAWSIELSGARNDWVAA